MVLLLCFCWGVFVVVVVVIDGRTFSSCEITIYNESEVTSSTLGQSSEVTLTSEVLSSEEIVHSSEDTSTTSVQSSELSSKYPHEVSSFIPFQHSAHSPSSVDKATASSTGNNSMRGFLLLIYLWDSTCHITQKKLLLKKSSIFKSILIS